MRVEGLDHDSDPTAQVEYLLQGSHFIDARFPGTGRNTGDGRAGRKNRWKNTEEIIQYDGKNHWEKQSLVRKEKEFSSFLYNAVCSVHGCGFRVCR